MVKGIVLASFTWFVTMQGYGQNASIQRLRTGDTLSVRLEYIACLYGLDTRIQFGLVHDNNVYKIRYADDSAWVPLTSDQGSSLQRFERECMKSQCASTSYVKVDVSCSSDTRSYQTCWSVADELVQVLKRR